MGEGLFQELKRLLDIIENYKREIEGLQTRKEGFRTVNEHIKLAIRESEEATQRLIDNIMDITSLLKESLDVVEEVKDERIKDILRRNCEKSLKILTESLTLLEFQDIVSQRLLKISNFITDLEKEILKILLLFGIKEEKSEEKREELKGKLEELEWKREVSQEDVDDILKQFGM